MSTALHTSAQVFANSGKLAEAFRRHGAPVVYARVDFNDFLELPVDEPVNMRNTPLPAIASEVAPSAGFLPGDIHDLGPIGNSFPQSVGSDAASEKLPLWTVGWTNDEASLVRRESQGVAFVSFRDNIDLSTPSGRLMFYIIGAMAEFERSLIQERVKAGLRNARAQGKKFGRPRVEIDAIGVAALRSDGLSWSRVCRTLQAPVFGSCFSHSTGTSGPRNLFARSALK